MNIDYSAFRARRSYQELMKPATVVWIEVEDISWIADFTESFETKK